MFRARWGAGEDISDRRVLAACAERAGLSTAEFLAALDDPRYRESVPKALQLAMQDRVFGVPFFVVGDQRFWGNDRIDFLLEALRNP